MRVALLASQDVSLQPTKSSPTLRIRMRHFHQHSLVEKIPARLSHTSMLQNRRCLYSLRSVCSCKLRVDAVRQSRPDRLLRRRQVQRRVVSLTAVHRNGERNPSLKVTWIDIFKTCRSWSWNSIGVSSTVQVDQALCIDDLPHFVAPVSSPSPRLSAVLDRSLFVAPPISPRFREDPATTPEPTRGRSIQFNDLDSSPYHVEPYPPRKSCEQAVLQSPDRRHLEGVYDRFLMATSGVKRVGKGYQSDNLKPVHNTLSTAEHAKASQARGFGVFGASKRAMPPPVSSDDAWRRSTSVDEFGFITAGQDASTSSSRTCKDENRSTFVRRAIKAMVPGKAVSRRVSRTIVV